MATASPAFLSGGGAMGALIRAHDWAVTPLGPIEGWSERLRAVVELMLASPIVSSLAVGPAAQSSVAGKVTSVNGASFVLGPSIGVGLYEAARPLPYLTAAAALVALRSRSTLRTLWGLHMGVAAAAATTIVGVALLVPRRPPPIG